MHIEPYLSARQPQNILHKQLFCRALLSIIIIIFIIIS